MSRHDVLVLGEINVDLILTANEITPVPGQERLVDALGRVERFQKKFGGDYFKKQSKKPPAKRK